MTEVVQQVVNGIVDGSIYALVAIGITLIFGLTGLVNFAHGELMMLGAYVALVVSTITGEWATVILAFFAALVALGLFGVALERTLFARTIKRPINGFIISLGLIFIIQNAVAIEWGTNAQFVDAPLQDAVNILGIEVAGIRLLILVVALLLSAGLYLFLNRTRIGTGLRCCNIDRDTATLMGVNVPAMQTLAFGVGCALAGAGGVLLAASHSFTPFFGSLVVVKGFVIALAGGLGNVSGAFWTAMIFGIVEAMTVQVGLAQYSQAIPFLVIILLLMVRPTGLFKGSHGSELA